MLVGDGGDVLRLNSAFLFLSICGVALQLRDSLFDYSNPLKSFNTVFS